MSYEKDRGDYRAMTQADLLNEVKRGIHVNWAELALVLAERLEDAERDYECPQCGY